MKYIRDDVDKFYEYGISIPTRTLYIGSNNGEDDSDFTPQLSERAIKGLHILDMKSDQGIDIILNSAGGDVYECLAIYDAIKDCRSEVTILVRGAAFSSASIILQAADKRIMSSNAIFMFHYGTDEMSEKHTKIFKSWSKESDRFDDWMEDLYLDKIREKHPKFKKSKLKSLLNFDKFLTAKQTVEMGLADEVLD